jgi:hypothetical protein
MQAGDIAVRPCATAAASSLPGNHRVIYSGGPITTVRRRRHRHAPGRRSCHRRDAFRRHQHHDGSEPEDLAIEARTAQGNVTISMNPKFGADIDAVIMTSDADVNSIHSDFPGLQTKSEQVGSRTRIHATGKVNGGGERVELYAEEGDIHISNLTASPVSIIPPLQ